MMKDKRMYQPPSLEPLSCIPTLNLLARASTEIEDISIDGLDSEGEI